MNKPQELHHRRVLVVDDDENLNVLLCRILHAHGYIVKSAHTGAEALAAIASEPFDAILLDLMMPAIGGHMVIEQLARERPDLVRRVVVLSAVPSEVVRMRVSGVSAVMKKPFTAPELISAVDAAMAT